MRTYAKPTWTSKAPALNLRLGSELGALAVLVWPTLAYAINCGDTLGPGGSAALDGPLACVESPALKIEGPFTLDLKGFTVSCVAQDGGLTGTGIEVAGVRAKVHNGTITDCEKGLVVEGGGRHVLKRLTVTSPDVKDDDQGIAFDNGIAFQVKSDRNWFIENTVEKYAGEGFRLGDDGVPADRNLLKGNKAISNANHGFRVRLGERNLLVLNRAEDNATEGFRSQGGRNRFVSNTAIGNGDEGFRLRDEEAVDNWLIGNIAKRNGLEPCDPEPPISDANPGIAITNDAAKKHDHQQYHQRQLHRHRDRDRLSKQQNHRQRRPGQPLPSAKSAPRSGRRQR
jgi:hypothetical protein